MLPFQIRIRNLPVLSPFSGLSSVSPDFQSWGGADVHLSPELAAQLLDGLPEKIRMALEARARMMNYPVWAVIEMAIAGYLDEEALSFVDCQPQLD